MHKDLQILIKCGNSLEYSGRSTVVNWPPSYIKEIFGDYCRHLQQATAKTETASSYHSLWNSLSPCDCSSDSYWDNGQKPGAIEPKRPQQSRRGSAWQKKITYLNSEMRSTWSLYIHPTRLVVQVFRQYEKHNMKKETEYHSIKIVCDTCFKYLVNEKKSLTTSVYLPCTLAWSLCVFKCLGIALP